MSLNGDGFVMRNGRSTSQVSIYNYPEHLNPFYEDDQHKRLRFWQINKKTGDGDGRRNSFSLSGLKDVWAFKSFRLKKKSSTLGVNKTSESPPPLRRDIQYSSTQMDNAFNSYDRRARYSSNNASPANNNFQRNAIYRSSLQNMNSTQDSSSGFGLNRNDQYRRTIQTAGAAGAQKPHSQQTLSSLPQSRRYVYGGSVTPQPLRSSEYGRAGDSREVLARGSSQLSVASTNPFDSDYEDDNEDTLDKSNNKHLTTSTPVSKRTTPHKKRRAPAPPVPVHKANGDEFSTAPSTESSQLNSHQRLHIDEEGEEIREIANLTAEIESFVKTTNDEPPEGQQLHSKKETTEKLESLKPNGAIAKESKSTTTEVVKIIATPAETTAVPAETTETTVKTTTTTVAPVKTTPTPVKRTATPVTATSSEAKTNTNAEHIIEKTPSAYPKELNNLSTKREAPIGSVECIHIHIDSPRATPERIEPSRVTSFRAQEQHQPETEKITGKTSFILASPPPTSPTSPTGSRKDELEIKTITDKPLATKRTTITTTTTTKTIQQQQQQGAVNNGSNDLRIIEPNTNTSNITPSTTDENNITNFKPPIAVKPNVEVSRTRISTLAEIHKPTKGILKHSVCESESYTEPAPIKKLEIKEALESTTSDATKKDASDAKVLSLTINTNEKVTTGSRVTPPRVAGLKIVEPVEMENQKQPLATTANFASTNNTPPTQPIRPPRTILQASTDEFETLYRFKPTTHMEWKNSTLAPLETNVPPEKRKSVKDIIESINRSQRLLNAAAHKDQAASLHIMRDAPASDNECGGSAGDGANGANGGASFSSLATTPQMQRKISEPNNNFNSAHLDENHREVHRFYKEMLDLRTAGTGANSNGNGAMSDAVSDEDHDATKINNNNNDDAQHKLDNSEVFKKCKVTKEVYHGCRESSPTASNLDWNPVPKPKRTKHMPEI